MFLFVLFSLGSSQQPCFNICRFANDVSWSSDISVTIPSTQKVTGIVTVTGHYDGFSDYREYHDFILFVKSHQGMNRWYFVRGREQGAGSKE